LKIFDTNGSAPYPVRWHPACRTEKAAAVMVDDHGTAVSFMLDATGRTWQRTAALQIRVPYADPVARPVVHNNQAGFGVALFSIAVA